MKFLLYLSCFFISYFTLSQTQAYIPTKRALEDIDYLITSIEEIHYNPYFKVNKEQFNTNKNDLLMGLNQDSIPFKAFVAIGMKLVAQMSGGHTALDWQNPILFPELKAYKFIPFTGELSDDNNYLRADRSAIPEIKKGDFIESINGISIAALYKECLTYFGGIESFKNVSCKKRLPLYLFFTGKLTAPYSIKTKNTEVSIKTSGIDVHELNSFISNAQPKENYTFDLIEDNIGLIAYNSCTNYKAFKKFLKHTFTFLKNEGVTQLIIDIRENGGGNSSLNDLLLSYITDSSYRQSSGRFWKVSEQSKLAYHNKLYKKIFGSDFMQQYFESENQSIIKSFDEELTHPEKQKEQFHGETCFLIGPNTFSSANFLADAIKTYNLSTLIGTETGEYTNDFGEQISLTLPYSGNNFYVSSTYDIGADGNPDVIQPVFPDIDVTTDVLNFAIDWITKEAKNNND